MERFSIEADAALNTAFNGNSYCADILQVYPGFYERVGFNRPWIGYFFKKDNVFVGCGGYKGKPLNNKIEIAYGTFKEFEGCGIATEICRELVRLALDTDPHVIVTARTLPENNTSTRVLKRNDFVFGGEVMDEEDGLVWEWIYERRS